MEKVRQLAGAAVYALDWLAMLLIVPFFAVEALGLVLLSAHPLANREPLRSCYLLTSIVLLLWIAPGYSFFPTAPGVTYKRKPRAWARVAGLACFAGAVLLAVA